VVCIGEVETGVGGLARWSGRAPELSDDQELATGMAGLDSCIDGTTYPAVGFGDEYDDDGSAHGRCRKGQRFKVEVRSRLVRVCVCAGRRRCNSGNKAAVLIPNARYLEVGRD
jgi:hypothetical protein